LFTLKSNFIFLSKDKIEELRKNSSTSNKKDIKGQKLENLFPFSENEQFKFGIFLGGVKIGESIINYKGIKELDGKKVVLITMESKVNNFYDKEEIYGDIIDFYPLLVKRKLRLWGKNVEIIEKYNKTENEVEIIRRDNTVTVEKIKSERKLNNIILFLFSLRAKKDIRVGQSLDFNLPTINMKMNLKNITKIKTPKGSFDAYYLKSEPSKYEAWLSCDNKLIPLKIKGAIGFGSTSLVLID